MNEDQGWLAAAFSEAFEDGMGETALCNEHALRYPRRRPYAGDVFFGRITKTT